MCVLKIHINSFIFEKKNSKIKKAGKIFSIYKKKI